MRPPPKSRGKPSRAKAADDEKFRFNEAPAEKQGKTTSCWCTGPEGSARFNEAPAEKQGKTDYDAVTRITIDLLQ